MSTFNASGKTAQESPAGKPQYKIVVVLLILLAILLSLGISYWTGNQVVSIKATYNGPTHAGTVLDSSNTNIQVIGRTRNRSVVTIPFEKWSVNEAQVLSPDATASVQIKYNGKTCELRVPCTDSQVAFITASYSGATSAGTVICNSTEGFEVTATLRDGSVLDITDSCTIDRESVTLKENKTAHLQIHYTDPFNNKVFSTSLDVICSSKTVRQIAAKYIGEALDGEILDNNNQSFIVTAVYDSGSVEQITGWEIRDPVTVTNSKSATVTIFYGGQETKVVVECRDYDSNVYKKNCSRYNYTDLVRYPETHIGAMIRFSGQIDQVYRETTTSSRCSYRIRVGYKQYINVAFHGVLSNGQLIEGDSVTCYGTFIGIDHNDNGYPIISAKIIDR